jgi:predicted RNA binding protein YcfA (HicA-like mRNA interferase family)
MGKRRYPPLKPSEVMAILAALGFTLKRTKGSHHHYERTAGNPPQRRLVTVDTAVSDFSDDLIKSMIRQSGVSREEFYRATPATARKIQ